jgi:hypothetical protein
LAKSLMSLDLIQKARSMASKAIIVALGTSLCRSSKRYALGRRSGLPLLALACTPLGGLTIAERDNEDQIRAISAKSFPVGSSTMAAKNSCVRPPHFH